MRLDCRLFFSLHDQGIKPIGVVVMGRQAQGIVRQCHGDMAPCEYVARRQHAEFLLVFQKFFHDVVVFFRQQTAGSVDQASSRFDQGRRGRQDAALGRGGLNHIWFSPFTVGVTPQGAGTAARRID